MTLTFLNSLGYHLSSLSQTRDFRRYACTVRPCSGFWWGHAEGDSIEEALSAAYEHCVHMETFGRSERQIKLSFASEAKEPMVQVSLESLGLAKPMKRRLLNGI